MIFNYRDISFERNCTENFDVLTMTFLDYHQDIRDITVSFTSVGRRSIWLAQFSGLTTEYTGSLREVLEKVYAHYKSNHIEPVEPATAQKEVE